MNFSTAITLLILQNLVLQCLRRATPTQMDHNDILSIKMSVYGIFNANSEFKFRQTFIKLYEYQDTAHIRCHRSRDY